MYEKRTNNPGLVWTNDSPPKELGNQRVGTKKGRRAVKEKFCTTFRNTNMQVSGVIAILIVVSVR